ncbi:MAG: DUF3108 domain-containing protein [candidate division Zixibacteria bacterium]|nr:DUF3108 domain-containing protein [candidate division Zixibacteria bacterium]
MPDRSLMHKILLGLVIFAGLIPVLYFVSVEVGIAEAAAGNADSVMEVDSIAVDAFDRFVENYAFGVGEKFSFDINYGFINAGYATLEVVRLIEYENRPCYLIESTANSNSFFSTFYKVRDRIESVVDAVGMFSWRFEKNLREGNYSADRMYTFNQRNNFAVYKGDTIEVAPFTQDPISTLYFTRTQPLEIGESFFLDNFVDGDKYHLEVRVLKRETVSVKAGMFDCIVVEPLTSSVGVFKNEGRLKIWLTDDYLKMPVLMKSKVLVGSITAELTDYKLGEIKEF